MPQSASKRDETRKAGLQRLLGDRGTVLARVERGTLERPAQGWYAVIDGHEYFLGDHSALAAARMGLILQQLDAELAHA